MKRWHALVVLSFLASAVAIGAPLLGDESDRRPDSAATATKESREKPKKGTAAKATNAKATKGARRRLPRHYGKLSLSDRQREKLYEIQARYQGEIEKLEKQLADLKAKEESECRKVLNADQKKQLADAADASKRDAAADASESESMEE